MGWQWHQQGHMQIICTSLETDNHASMIATKTGMSEWMFLLLPVSLVDVDKGIKRVVVYLLISFVVTVWHTGLCSWLCFSTQDLHSVLPIIIEHIFGFGAASGSSYGSFIGPHAYVTQSEFNVIHDLLGPEGSLLRVVSKLAADSSCRYEFPISCLPVYHYLLVMVIYCVITALLYASMVYAIAWCLSSRLSHASIVSKLLKESSCFSAQRLPCLTDIPRCLIREFGYLQKIRVIPSGTWSQILNVTNFSTFFCHSTSSFANDVTGLAIASLSHWAAAFVYNTCIARSICNSWTSFTHYRLLLQIV